jgi:hypothetical protein
MKKIAIIVIVLLVFGILGCRSVKDSVLTTKASNIDIADFVQAATYVLTDNGLTVTLVNENIGLITTDWINNDSIMTGKSRLKISLTYNKKTNSIVITPNKEAEAYVNKSLSDTEKRFLEKIMKEINEMLGNNSEIKWVVKK